MAGGVSKQSEAMEYQLRGLMIDGDMKTDVYLHDGDTTNVRVQDDNVIDRQTSNVTLYPLNEGTSSNSNSDAVIKDVGDVINEESHVIAKTVNDVLQPSSQESQTVVQMIESDQPVSNNISSQDLTS